MAEYDPNEFFGAERKMSNGDRIRAASEDELIEWYCRHRDCGTCDYGHDVDCTIRAWLKQEVDNGNTDT